MELIVSLILPIILSIHQTNALAKCTDRILPANLVYVKNITGVLVRIVGIVEKCQSDGGGPDSVYMARNCLTADIEGLEFPFDDQYTSCGGLFRDGDCSVKITYSDTYYSPPHNREPIEIWTNGTLAVLKYWTCTKINQSLFIPLRKAVEDSYAEDPADGKIYPHYFEQHTVPPRQAKYPVYFYILVVIIVLLLFLAMGKGASISKTCKKRRQVGVTRLTTAKQ